MLVIMRMKRSKEQEHFGNQLNCGSRAFFKSGVKQLLCLLCLRDGLQVKLIDSVQWKNGNLKQVHLRLLHVGSPILLVSKLYKCENGTREVVACDLNIVKQIPTLLFVS